MFFLLNLLIYLNQDCLIAYTPVVESNVEVIRHAPTKEWNEKDFKRE